MRRIILDGTDMITSKVGFGTASLHHVLFSAGRRAILRAAVDGGITHFDTARLYGNGIAESEIGLYFGGMGRDNITVATKVGFDISKTQRVMPRGHKVWRKLTGGTAFPVTDYSVLGCERSFSNSLRALRTDRVDILFIHEPILASQGELLDLIPWLFQQKKLGKTRFIGLAGETIVGSQILENFPGVFDILQSNVNYTFGNATRPLTPQIQYGTLTNICDEKRVEAFRKIRDEDSNRMILYSSRKYVRVEDFTRLMSKN